MPTLSDKLKSLGVKVGAQDLVPRAQPSRQPTGSPAPNSVEEVLPGRFIPTDNGEAYLVEALYDTGYVHGSTPISGFASRQSLAAWAGEQRIFQCEDSGFAYIDIETTGLQGGTGTYAFLIGAGRMTPDGFKVVQFFMRDPNEEPAQLRALEEFLAPCQAIVTYNGKAFDIPILTTRYLTWGWRSPFKDLAHLDLLPLARKLWRARLQSRTLGNVETFILGARRTAEDVPGWLIPQLFFDYLRSGDARPLKGVFYHNEVDVVSMAALLNHMTHLLDDPLHTSTNPGLDMIGLGRFYEDLGRIEEATGLYRQSLEMQLPEDVFWPVLERLSFIYKRTGQMDLAIHLWQQAAQHRQIYAHVELAKYYEHTSRDAASALKWTQAAVDLLKAPGTPYMTQVQWLTDLQHRLERLSKKNNKSSE